MTKKGARTRAANANVDGGGGGLSFSRRCAVCALTILECHGAIVNVVCLNLMMSVLLTTKKKGPRKAVN